MSFVPLSVKRMHSEKTKTGLPIGSVHGNPVASVQLRQPGYPEYSGPVAFPAAPSLAQWAPTGYGGQASHDYSWFGFFGLSVVLLAYIISNYDAKDPFNA